MAIAAARKITARSIERGASPRGEQADQMGCTSWLTPCQPALPKTWRHPNQKEKIGNEKEYHCHCGLQGANPFPDNGARSRGRLFFMHTIFVKDSVCLFLVIALAIGLSVHPASAADANNKSSDASLEQIRKLAEEGNPEAQYKQGRMYDEGLGLPQDPKEAAK